MVPPLRAGFGALVLLLLVAPQARAAGGVAKWTEWHATGDDAQLTIDASGHARVEHAIRYRVVMGPLRQFDVTGIEKNAELVSAATVTSEDGREIAAHVDPKSEGALRLIVDEPKGLRRGSYTFHLRYDVDLVAAKELVRDGAMWRLAWRSPVAGEGYDGAHVTIRVPSAQTEPRPVKTGPRPHEALSDGAEGGEDGVIATLHRTGDRDELELVRPHVARGESPLWAARLDPKAFPDVRTPELRPPPPPPAPEPDRLRETALGAGLLAVALLMGALVRTKMRAFASACAKARAKPAPLVPVSPGVAGALAGIFSAVGVLLELAGWPTAGAALLVLAMGLAVSRTPKVRPAPRGPGRWLALRPGEALAPSRADGHWLDVGTRSGRIAAALALALLVALAIGSRALGPEAPYLVAMDALALVPLFLTGRRAQLPPDPAIAPVPLLRAAFGALQKDKSLKVAPWARVPLGAEMPDELRLLVVPRASLPGLVGIELGLAWTRTATGYAPRAEVLVRVHDGSDAAARLPQFAPFARPLTGRRPDERVIRLTPILPGTSAAIALVRRVARELNDRRVVIGGWEGPERRVVDRTDRVAAAA